MSPSLYARICFERILAQIFGKSCCCMQEYALKVYGLRYSGNPAAVCMNIFWHSTGSDTREILPVYAGIYSDTPLAQILGKSMHKCIQDYALKVCWLRYSVPARICKHILWHSTGSDTREIALSNAGICFKSVLAQILGASCCCMQGDAVQIHWLRYSGNPAAVSRHIFWHSTGSDTREIFLVYAGIYSDTLLAQILGESYCCMQAYSGTPLAQILGISPCSM